MADAAYKVVFLAFPLEAYGTAAQRADLMQPHVRLLRVLGRQNGERGRRPAAPLS